VALEANSRETLALVTKLQSKTTARIERVRSIEKELAALQHNELFWNSRPISDAPSNRWWNDRLTSGTCS
jgi:hypothetical protein